MFHTVLCSLDQLIGCIVAIVVWCEYIGLCDAPGAASAVL